MTTECILDELPSVLNVIPYFWVTAKRRIIPVKSMSTEHIQNCIACLEGRGNKIIPENYLGGKEKWLTIFNEELIRRQ